MILTSCRVICVNKKNSAFKAFDLPLSLISNEGFAQPIFGANYIHGKCKPLLNSLPGDINFKIWLMNGGCGTFAPAYLKMVASCKRNKGRGAEQSVVNSYQGGGKKAYIDPNDPSVIYLQQPEVAQNINYNPWGYQSIPQSEPMQIGPNQQNSSPKIYNQPAPIPPQQQYNQNNYQNQNNGMPQNNPNNVNNNYPSFDQFNQANDIDLPSEQELYNNQNKQNQQQAYPNQGMGGMNEVINNQQQQQGGKYFGFFGPSLERNQPNNNSNA